MVHGRGTDIDADPLCGQIGRHDAGVLQRLPHHLQQQTLLRIHVLRLTQRDAEGCRVKSLEPLEHAGREGVGLALCARYGVIEWLFAPAVFRDL